MFNYVLPPSGALQETGEHSEMIPGASLRRVGAPAQRELSILEATAIENLRIQADIAHHNDPVYQIAVRAGAGNPGASQWADSQIRKRLVFMLRACDSFQVAVCPTMIGHKLLNELLNQGRQNVRRLRDAGFSVPMSYRLAYGFATASRRRRTFCLP